MNAADLNHRITAAVRHDRNGRRSAAAPAVYTRDMVATLPDPDRWQALVDKLREIVPEAHGIVLDQLNALRQLVGAPVLHELRAITDTQGELFGELWDAFDKLIEAWSATVRLRGRELAEERSDRQELQQKVREIVADERARLAKLPEARRRPRPWLTSAAELVEGPF